MILHTYNPNIRYYGLNYIQLSLSNDFIAAVSSFGLVHIWVRNDYKPIHQDGNAHHGKINGVKIWNNTLITGDDTGVMNIFNLSEENVTKVRTINVKRMINHIDFDGTNLLLGTNNSLLLMVENESRNMSEKLHIDTDFICMCMLSYPFAITSNNSKKGIEIWDLREGTLLKVVLEEYHYFEMDLRNGILAVAPYLYPGYREDSSKIYLVNMETIEDEDVQTRPLKVLNNIDFYDRFCCVVINDSKIIQSNGQQMIIQDFWYYDQREPKKLENVTVTRRKTFFNIYKKIQLLKNMFRNN